MAELSIIEHTESTVSSVRSTISTASSGYAIISVPAKQREDVRTVYPAEPPPDYDDPPIQREGAILPRYKDSRQTSPMKDYESKVPLLSQHQPVIREEPRTAGRLQTSPTKDHESRLPLLTEETVYTDQSQQQQTIVRISSKSKDLNIEIVSNPAGSPSSTNTSFLYTPSPSGRGNSTLSPESTTRDTSFIFQTSNSNDAKRKGCSMTTREKILVGVVVLVLVALVLIVVNFTACIGDFTSAC